MEGVVTLPKFAIENLLSISFYLDLWGLFNFCLDTIEFLFFKIDTPLVFIDVELDLLSDNIGFYIIC